MAPAAGSFPSISKSELFARLAAGHAAGITVVTPNRRLAQVLRAEFDVFQEKRGSTVWEDADILPLEVFVARRYEDARYERDADGLPLLLTDAQARLLWEEVIGESRWAGALLDVPQTASRAMDAWRLAHAWGIADALGKAAATEDTRAFSAWARAYARRLEKDGLVDAATLPGLKLAAPKTKVLVAYAFDVLPPQVLQVLGDFLSCRPEGQDGTVAKTSFASPGLELESAARWARARLEAGARRIGVVVPGLALRRRETARVFTRVMGSALPFNISIGEPLSAYPVVAAALALLELQLREIDFERASRLVRSPFIAGAEAEMAARARLDAALRGKSAVTISLPKLISEMGDEMVLRSHFEKVFELKPENNSPHGWARHFTAVLDAAGFPGERALDSAEYQARAKFNDQLGELARLSLVSAKLSGPQALARLRRLCSETLFQPEGPQGEGQAPVQVLGALESIGIEFDALWVSGLTDDAWPLRAHPDPFLPVRLQKEARIPEASAEDSLALDRLRTEGWRRAAGEVVFSWAARDEDRDLLPSTLIPDVVERDISLPSYQSWRSRVFHSGKTETYIDETAPPLVDTTVRGGTRLLADQAACPFRAFARHRLRAKELDSPEAGLDPIERGNLVHLLMENLWKEAKSSAALDTDLAPAIERAAAAAVAELGVEGRFAELEKARLARLATDWLEVERKRAPFEVVKTEEEALRPLGPLKLKGRIDRMDKLADSSHVLIDYKTGSSMTPKMWRGTRPDEPQLPFYAVTGGEEVSAVAFAKFRAGQMRFMGYERDKGTLPRMTHYPDWQPLLAEWKASLEGLAQGYAAGQAQVNPKRQLATCRNCDLHTLCRVHEKLSALEEEEGEE